MMPGWPEARELRVEVERVPGERLGREQHRVGLGHSAPPVVAVDVAELEIVVASPSLPEAGGSEIRIA